MSGETKESESGLTVDTLKLLMETEIRRVDERFAAFLGTYGRDQDKSNEFRAALDDLSKAMATRRELEAAQVSGNLRIDALAKDIGDLRSRLDIGPVGLPQLQAFQQLQTGRQQGIGSTVGYIVTAVIVTAALVGLIAALVPGH